MALLVCLLILWLCIVALATSAYWLDRLIVFVMKSYRIHLYPTAIRLALSIETQADEWMLNDDKLIHPIIGKVWLVTSGTIIVSLPDTNQSCDQDWRPKWIERRIIRDAATALIRSRRDAQLDRVLPRLS